MKTTSVHTPTSVCRLGLGFTDITPPIGMYHRMWGAAKHDRSTGVHRTLRATALILEPADGNASLRHIFISLDHCMFRPPEMDELKQRTCELLKVGADGLTIVFSHTHGAGLLTRDRADLPGGDLIGPYLDALPAKIVAAVKEAQEFLEPVTLTYGSADCRMGHERDCWDDARGIFVCGFNPDVEWSLPVMVVRATDAEGDHVTTLVTYPCHPTTLAYENTLISPDYVGALRSTIEDATQCPCLFLLAPCGDIGPREGFVGDFAVADRNGRQVGYAALQALEAMGPVGHDFNYLGPVISGATLGNWRFEPQSPEATKQATRFERRRIEVPLDYQPGLPTLEQARAELIELQSQEAAARAKNDEAETARLRALVERKRRLIERIAPLPAGQLPYLVDLWRVGDAIWICIDGEPYYALQSELQKRFPDRTILVLTLANGAKSSYLPTREAYQKALYQVEVSFVAPGSLERIIDAIDQELRTWLQE